MKKIVMYKGDEYRAKTEEKFVEGLFFSDVYKRANSICCEIIQETEKYLDGNKEAGYQTKYHGMGNNMIAFCAERGQGKTTAMQSYAAYLQDRDPQKKFFGEEGIDKEKYDFVVLDPIDPSSLDHGESIVRVLISRLFYLLSEQMNQHTDSRDEKEFRREREEILALFQRCYENIDYLQKEKNVEEDDLEVLAQLGNSAQLKKNLCGLVDRFLHIYCQGGRRERDGFRRQYLVVQIDDADLSMGDVFEVCENIRNYFTIPNMIVMMAANYTQLKTAIHERYLNRYGKLVSLPETGRFAGECHHMAYRYLEKMLPAGHRIDLPEVDAMFSEGSQAVRLEYYQDEETEIFQKEATRCMDMQEQLLKLLYLRTGMVLLKRPGELHPFLPHTMRELTHFVKLLGDMDTVCQQRIFPMIKQTGNEREIEKWKANLLLLKEYFLNYWCGTHLGYGQQNLVRELDQAKRNMTNAFRSINEYLKNSGKKRSLRDDTFRNVLTVIEERMRDEPALREAMQFYYSILLNEWFVWAMEEPDQFKKISAFIEEPVAFEPGFKNGEHRYAGQYDVIEFTVPLETLKAALEKQNVPEGQIIEWLKTFCVAVGEEDLELAEVVEGKLVWNEEVEELQFHMFKPVMTMLYSGAWHGEDSTGAENQDSMGDDEQETRKREIDSDDSMAYVISVKNMVANLEVQQYVRAGVQQLIRRFERRKTISQWKAIYDEIYGMLDSWVENEAGYLGEQSVIREKCSEYLGKETGQLVFLCNDHNRKQYKEDYREYLLDRVTDIIVEIEKIEEIATKSSEKETQVVLKRVVTAKRQVVFSGIVIGEQEVLKGLDKTLDSMMDVEQEINKELDRLSKETKENEVDWDNILKMVLIDEEDDEGNEENEESSKKDDSEIRRKVVAFKDKMQAYKEQIEKM